MIRKFDDVFKLDTKNTTYLIRVSKFNHILNDYYGRKILDESFDFSKEKYNAPSGTAVNYSEEDFNYVLDTLSLEISSPYKGDYKEPSLIVDNSRDFILDLVYLDYEIKDELTKLENHFENLKNVHVSALEENGNITFLHKIKNGSVDKSYGIHVAKLANLPKPLIKRANEILSDYESNGNIEIKNQISFDLDEKDEENIALEKLKQINPYEITPIEALNILYELKKDVDNNK